MSQAGSYGDGGTILPDIETITGNVGGAVGPTGGNIDIFGFGPYIFTGDPGLSELVLTDDGTIAIQYETNDGIAIPDNNKLYILGIKDDNGGVAQGINTRKDVVDDTVLIELFGYTEYATVIGDSNGSLITVGPGTDGQLLIGATGSAPLWGTLTAGAGIGITNNANEIIITNTGGGGGGGATTFDTDAGTATEVSGVIEIAGGTNINTTGAGNVVTVNLDDDVTLAGFLSAGTTVTAVGDITTTTGDVNVTAGDINLPNSASGVGNITFNNRYAIHNGGSTDNFFVGDVAGNYTLTGTANMVFGGAAGASLTSGEFNTLMGATSGIDMTSSVRNSGFGYGALASITSGAGRNTAIGYLSGSLLLDGNRNIFIGNESGSAYTGSEDSNIIIGNSGTLGDTNTIRVGVQGSGAGQQDTTFIAGIYNTTPGSGTTQVAIIDDNGQLGSSEGTDGQVLIGSTAGSPAWANLTAGANITINNAGNSIEIVGAAGGGGLTWNETTTATVNMVADNGYIMNRAGPVTATMPAAILQGEVVRVTGKGAGGWIIDLNGGQTIQFGNMATTTGTGTLESTNAFDSVEILCITDNTDFVVLSSIGNITVT